MGCSDLAAGHYSQSRHWPVNQQRIKVTLSMALYKIRRLICIMKSPAVTVLKVQNTCVPYEQGSHFFARIGSPFSSSWANFIPLIFIYRNYAKSSLFPFKLRWNHKNKSFFVFDLFFLFYSNFSFLFSSFWWSNLLFIYSFKRYKIIDLKNSVILFISS